MATVGKPEQQRLGKVIWNNLAYIVGCGQFTSYTGVHAGVQAPDRTRRPYAGDSLNFRTDRASLLGVFHWFRVIRRLQRLFSKTFKTDD